MARYGFEYYEDLTYEEKKRCRDELADIRYEREVERRELEKENK